MLTTGDGENYFKCDTIGSTDEGERWDDGAGGHVKRIVICHDRCKILSIQTTYERQGHLRLSRRHGASGPYVEVISFSEPLKWVSGSCGRCLDSEDEVLFNVVRSLKFGTDHETYGPFGCDSNPLDSNPMVYNPLSRPFHFKTSTWIGGFYGCCNRADDDDGLLSNIGVYIGLPADSLLDKPPSPVVARFAIPPRGRS